MNSVITPNSLRSDLAVVSQWVQPGARVLDLGCGDGALLAYLQQQRQVQGYGLELNPDKLQQCLGHGVNVIQRDLNAGLDDFRNQSFDVVILSQALQVVEAPDALLRDMLRVGRQGIVTFPNFGHWSTRLGLLLNGRMPRTRSLPAHWYDTQNIHLCTLKDFEALCAEEGFAIVRRAVTDANHQHNAGARIWPNLRAEVGLYLLEGAGE